MRLLRSALLYLALALGANDAARAADYPDLKRLATGDMRKLSFLEEPRPVSDLPFRLGDGSGTATLAMYRGKYILLNFWATWCAPCRKEMPRLAALQEEFGGDRFEVVTLATGRNRAAAIDRFFRQIGVTNLPRHTDPKMAIARDMKILGLPVTLIVDPQGREIARLLGDADWDSDSARAIIAALLAHE